MLVETLHLKVVVVEKAVVSSNFYHKVVMRQPWIVLTVDFDATKQEDCQQADDMQLGTFHFNYKLQS